MNFAAIGCYFRNIYVSYCLSDLSEATDTLYADKNGHRLLFTNVNAFGNQDDSALDTFGTQRQHFVCDDPFVVEMILCHLLKYLIHISDELILWTLDLTINGLWPLLIRQLNIGGLKLKKHCLELLTSLMELGCLHKSSKVQWNLVSYTFKLVKKISGQDKSNGELCHSLVKMLSIISKFYSEDTNMKRICDHHSMELWNFIQEPNQPGLHGK